AAAALRSAMATFFFFSSRRRHTRWPRDWSSDVCSSDLADYGAQLPNYPYAPPDYDGDPDPDHSVSTIGFGGVPSAAGGNGDSPRSEERRVGKECRSRWWAWR